MIKPFISLKILNQSGRTVRKIASRKSKRIFAFIQAGKFEDCMFWVKVNYGHGFINEGEYENIKDLIHALKAFLERDLWET